MSEEKERRVIDSFFSAIGVMLGVTVILIIVPWLLNIVERGMLSQDCENYFETLYEQNLVPHRCYLEEPND